jgi:hypothetical protein
MKKGPQKPLVLGVLSLAILIMSIHSLPPVHASSPMPVVGIWSNTYGSSLISDTSLLPNTLVSVEINATNAPPFNGYDLTLFYDSTYLKAVSVDVKTGTAFNNPFIVQSDLVIDGRVRLAVVNVGSAFTDGNGIIAHINFNITGKGASPLVLAAGTINPSQWSQSWTELVLGSSPIEIGTSDGYFRNVPGDPGPSASFTFSPLAPQEGDSVVFDASTSFDHDQNNGVNKGIARYIWEFGDGTSDNTVYPGDIHRFTQVFGFNFYGNFSVRLTVVDSDQQFEGMKTARVQIGTATPPTRNFEISTNTIPRGVVAGSSVTYSIGLQSLGGFSGPVSLLVSLIPTLLNGPTTSIPARVNLRASGATSVSLTVHTGTITPPGRYTIIITASRAQLSHSGIVFLTVD